MEKDAEIYYTIGRLAYAYGVIMLVVTIMSVNGFLGSWMALGTIMIMSENLPEVHYVGKIASDVMNVIILHVAISIVLTMIFIFRTRKILTSLYERVMKASPNELDVRLKK